jgi:hypothetical protein
MMRPGRRARTSSGIKGLSAARFANRDRSQSAVYFAVIGIFAIVVLGLYFGLT